MPSLDLDGSPRSPRDSRRFVNETAQDWGVHGDQLDVARLLATELVTNAMLHGAPPIRIAAHRSNSVVRIESVLSAAVDPSTVTRRCRVMPAPSGR